MSTPHVNIRDLESRTRAENEFVLGTLRIAAAHRDLAMTMTGDDALRIMAAHAGGPRGDAWNDLLDPLTSHATAGWFVFDRAQIIAMTWEPDWIATNYQLLEVTASGGRRAAAAARLLDQILRMVEAEGGPASAAPSTPAPPSTDEPPGDEPTPPEPEDASPTDAEEPQPGDG